MERRNPVVLYGKHGYQPSLATNKLAKASGILVPAANSVNPITVSGISKVSPEMLNKYNDYCLPNSADHVMDCVENTPNSKCT